MCIIIFILLKNLLMSHLILKIDILGSFNLWDEGFTYMLIRKLFHMSVFEHQGALQMVKGFL